MKVIKSALILLMLSCLISCQRFDNSLLSRERPPSKVSTNNSTLAEVAVPQTIAQLETNLESYVPQVKIIAPRLGETFSQTNIGVELTVENLPVFRDEKLQLGNHLNLIVDNEPAKQIYNPKEPIILTNLTPGTHSVRVIAVRPWGESFKNEAAYAQTSFNILTETNDNRPDIDRPLLTYNSPTGVYGAEPILLDFYLTNAPLHAIAKNNPNLKDWRVRATVNGTGFILENWQPVYLTGLKPGENWVQLELIDETGNNIENAFNNTVRVFQYDPQQLDTLAKLVTDKIPTNEARAIVEPRIVASNFLAEDTEVIDDEVNSVPVVENEPSIETPEPTVSTASKEEPIVKQLNDTVQPTTRSETQKKNEQSNSETTATDRERVEVEQPKVETEQTIAILEPDSEEAVITIDLHSANSSEITEPEIEITTVPSKPDGSFEAIEPKETQPQWWKKFLVGLRRQIEALAQRLPDRV